MYQSSKIKLNATGEPKFSMFNDLLNVGHGPTWLPIWITAFSCSCPDAFVYSKFEGSILAGYSETEINATGEPISSMFNDP